MSPLLSLLVLQVPFPDVPADHWAAGAVGALKTAGIVRGYPEPAPQEDPPFGKSNAQILAMGRKAWVQFAAEKKGGGSTMAYVNAEGLYADALGERNDKAIAKLPAAKVRAIKELRSNLITFGNGFISVGTAITGGGTMWNMFSASMATDAEEVVADALQPKPYKGSAVTIAQVRSRFPQVTAVINRERKNIDSNKVSSNMDTKATLGALQDTRLLLENKIVPSLAKLDPNTRLRVLKFLLDKTKTDSFGN